MHKRFNKQFTHLKYTIIEFGIMFINKYTNDSCHENEEKSENSKNFRIFRLKIL